EVLDGWALLKQDRSHHVHPDVCALCRKNGCNQQLPCIGMVESAFGICIHVAQRLQNFPHTLWRSWAVFCGGLLRLADLVFLINGLCSGRWFSWHGKNDFS